MNIQTGSPIPAGHQAAHYASYASITAVPLTPPCSSASRDNSVVMDGQSDMCADSSAGDGGNSSQVDLPLRDDMHTQFRIPYDHAPVYYLKVFVAPAPLR